MLIEKIDLYEYFGIKREKGASGYLTTYIAHNSKEYCEQRKRPAIIIAPGGGYEFLSDRECEPVALKYMAEGYNAFTLEYSLYPLGYPTQLIEGAMAVAYVKENAKKLGVKQNNVCAIGFSAGGHFVGMLATLYNDKNVVNALGEKSRLAKPDAVILSYPVISAQDTHEGTMRTISKGDSELREYLSLEKRVDSNSVPAFIWATVDDNDVPSTNSLKMACAYKSAGVDFELHIYTHGVHGLSLATRETAREGDERYIREPVSKWFESSVEWLKERGFNMEK